MKLFLAFYLFFTGMILCFLFQDKTRQQSIQDGSEIYQDFCVQCHLDNGKGVSGVFPPLKNSDYLMNDLDRSIAGIKFGLQGAIEVNDEIYDGIMNKQGLDDEEIADVMNYILNQWGNQYKGLITQSWVQKIDKSSLN
ncbi:MAG: cytochrome c [Flavobacteriaceae bacterium]